MSNHNRYYPDDGRGHRRRNIDFENDSFDNDEDFDSRRDGRDDYYDDEYRNDYRDDDYRDEDYRDADYDAEPEYPRQSRHSDYYPADESRRGSDRQGRRNRTDNNRYYDDASRREEDDNYANHYPRGYREGYRDAVRDTDGYRSAGRGQGYNDSEMTPEKPKNFYRRHPVLSNFLMAIAASVLLIYIALWFLDFWTFHGQERAVPNVKGQSYEMALGNIDRAGLRAVVTDSVYDSYARPGTVVEQTPIPSARIKKGGAVYLTLVAYTPKMVTIPDFYDVSERQARSMLEGLGITQIMTVKVPSEYAGLVLGARFNGVSLRPGAKVPVSAVITLEVGEGMEDLPVETDSLVDTEAIEQVIDALNID